MLKMIPYSQLTYQIFTLPCLLHFKFEKGTRRCNTFQIYTVGVVYEIPLPILK